MDAESLCQQCAKAPTIPLLTICAACFNKNKRYRSGEAAQARAMRVRYSLPRLRKASGNYRDPDTAREHRARKGQNRPREIFTNDGLDDVYYSDEQEVNSRTQYHGENYPDE